MRLAWLSSRQVQRRLLISLIVSAFTFWCLLPTRKHELRPANLEERYPLLWRHVHACNGSGGAWYIPPNWLSSAGVQPENIVDAALLASQVTSASRHRHIEHSSIPLLLHQTWKNRRIDTWSDLLRLSVEKWLRYVVSDDMAYFFWEDDGVLQMLDEFEPDFVERFRSLPSNVERADVFRILVLKWFGGIYADVDTQPLRRPSSWISPSDLAPWTDPVTNSKFSSDNAVSIVLGIEADCPPDKDDYWRMGYSYPVQLTQWALASSSGHPILLHFMDTLQRRLNHVANRYRGDLTDTDAAKELRQIGPLSLTGPVAITVAAMTWLEEQAGLRWNALTGLFDGGRSKLVDDVLILPITGFSPGRRKYGNMGSKPVTDPSARVWHRAQGSWRSFDVKVEYGKFCRSVFGLCKDWSKQPA
ncbi:glycosyl transferase [Cladophialophora carrionii]|uniref:Glycosyl transferase n=1 Tax=Cladophialophora carrionii TaxID=86049 RepID=A0A1C1CHT2_9EURO|nr:glycosyl transferase [Cladophialophora carrionii]